MPTFTDHVVAIHAARISTGYPADAEHSVREVLDLYDKINELAPGRAYPSPGAVCKAMDAVGGCPSELNVSYGRARVMPGYNPDPSPSIGKHSYVVSKRYSEQGVYLVEEVDTEGRQVLIKGVWEHAGNYALATEDERRAGVRMRNLGEL